MSTHPVVAEDVGAVLARTEPLLADLKGSCLFLSGASGFVGTWLLEALVAANHELRLGCRIIALSRDPARLLAKVPHLALDRTVTWITGDVRDFAFPSASVTHVIHAATDSHGRLNTENPQEMFSVCLDGTRRVLALAQAKRVERMLFVSSGAVYGPQPPTVSHIPEVFFGGPDHLDPKSAYAEGKRASEHLCGIASLPSPAGCGLTVTIARCFTFIGPHLPLNAQFAIGNFIRDAVAGGPIIVTSDGTPCRSYLYAADLAEWLLTILLRGTRGRAYNVGSERSISIADLAACVASIAHPTTAIRSRYAPVAAAPSLPPKVHRYVPSCKRAHEELGLVETMPLDQAISRTMRFVASFSGHSSGTQMRL